MVVQLIQLLMQPQNRDVGRKLMIYTMFMFTIPIATFYGFQKYVLPPETKSKDMWSGFAAVASVNVIIVFYIISAFREDRDEVKAPPPRVGLWAMHSQSKERTD